MYKHIIWDFDGTLFDSYPVMAQAFKMALQAHHIEEDDDVIVSLMRISMSHLFEHYKKIIETSDILTQYSDIRSQLEYDTLKPFKDAELVCKTITSLEKYNYLYTHRGLSAVQFIQLFQMKDDFMDYVIKEDNFKRKPDPEALLHLIKKHQMKPDEVIMVGDRSIDILAAKNAGITSCYFSYGQFDVLTTADYTITSLEQLLEIIK